MPPTCCSTWLPTSPRDETPRMSRPHVHVLTWLPDGTLTRWGEQFPECEFVDACEPAVFDRTCREATVAYGLPPVACLGEARRLRWVQLTSAGVPHDLCPAARSRGITVTNLAGLYGPSIAEHALALVVMLARNLHTVVRNQQQRRWDRDVH